MTPVDELTRATCSNGAPSARNLLVTVFGDALLPLGDSTAASVASLTTLLGAFGVNDRLVRTSLSRLVDDGLVSVRRTDRRSAYMVAPASVELFRRADDRIYRTTTADWDGSWTLVVIDGSEATARRRAALRQALTWAGLGVVAPNVLASPVVDAHDAAAVVTGVGGFANVLVSRSTVIETVGTLGSEELARRCVGLDDIADGYGRFIDQFERFGVKTARELQPEAAWKLRTLLVGSFRRIVLSDPLLPVALLPADWSGAAARRVAGELYRAAFPRSQEYLASVIGTDLVTVPAAPPPDRF